MRKLSIILDTSFLIALNNARDINHNSAQSVKSRLKEREFGPCYVSDYIFDEFVTFLMAKSLYLNKIREVGDALLAEESIKFLRISEDLFLQSWEFFKKHNNLSFTDCTTVILAKEFGIKNIASFDSDFDRINSIKRI